MLDQIAHGKQTKKNKIKVKQSKKRTNKGTIKMKKKKQTKKNPST